MYHQMKYVHIRNFWWMPTALVLLWDIIVMDSIHLQYCDDNHGYPNDKDNAGDLSKWIKYQYHK